MVVAVYLHLRPNEGELRATSCTCGRRDRVPKRGNSGRLTMPWLRRLTTGAAVAPCGLALVLAEGPTNPGPAGHRRVRPTGRDSRGRPPRSAWLSPGRSTRAGRTSRSGSGSACTAGALRQPRRSGSASRSPSWCRRGDGRIPRDLHRWRGTGWLIGVHRGIRERSGHAAPESKHQHDIDPLSAGLLLADGINVLTVGVLLLRRPRCAGPAVTMAGWPPRP